jgi:uncharacterized protein (TIGR03437 family)
MASHRSAIAVMALLTAFHPCPAWSADPPPTGFATTLRYADFGYLGTARQILTDRSGNVVVVGVIVNRPAPVSGSVVLPDTSIAVTKLDNNGHVVFRFVFGGTGYNDPRGAAMDAVGNVYFGGVTVADDFPLVNALIPKTAPKVNAGFVAKLDPTGSHLAFSTRIGGVAAGQGPNAVGGTEVNALALDGQNNVYVTGTTYAADFPVTPSAFQTLPGTQFPTATQSDAFVVKLSSTGDRLIYSTLLGGSQKNCNGGGTCNDVGSADAGLAIAVDGSGQATVAGETSAPDFPVTPGVFQTQCKCATSIPRPGTSTGFVSRLNATGTALVWSTFLGGTQDTYLPGYGPGAGGVSTLALDNVGNVFVAGYTASYDFPVTPGAFQHYVVPDIRDFGKAHYSFAAKLNASGTALLYSTFLAGDDREYAANISADSQGHVWIVGTTTYFQYAYIEKAPDEFLMELETDGSRLLQSYRMPAGRFGQNVLVVSPLNVLTLGSSGEVLLWFFGDASGPSLTGIANAGATTVSGRVAPGEIVSIYGVRLGPTTGAGLRLDADGRVATSLAGVQVLFDGRPAPLVYVSDTQINAIAPFEIASKASTTVQVVTQSGFSPPLTLTVVPADPGLFRSPTGWVAALNQDGTINSDENPAWPDSIIALYLNGAGLLDPLPADGSVAGAALAKPVLPVSVTFDNVPAEILYAGAAPGLVAGVLQINVRIHSNAAIQVKVGSAISEQVYVVLNTYSPTALPLSPSKKAR